MTEPSLFNFASSLSNVNNVKIFDLLEFPVMLFSSLCSLPKKLDEKTSKLLTLKQMFHLHSCHIFLTCETFLNMSCGTDNNYKLLITFHRIGVYLMNELKWMN